MVPVDFSTEIYRFAVALGIGALVGFERQSRLERSPSEYDEATPERMREYQAMVPGSEVHVLPEAGHVSNFDQPKLFNEALIHFFETVEGR